MNGTVKLHCAIIAMMCSTSLFSAVVKVKNHTLSTVKVYITYKDGNRVFPLDAQEIKRGSSATFSCGNNPFYSITWQDGIGAWRCSIPSSSMMLFGEIVLGGGRSFGEGFREVFLNFNETGWVREQSIKRAERIQ